jgi:hypothetical protein
MSSGASQVLDRLRACAPEELRSEALTLEEIFVAALKPAGGAV